MRYYLDEHLPPLIAVRLRRLGIDAVAAVELGMLSVEDSQHMALAASLNRCS